MASRLQDVILRGLAAARPVATTVAPGTLYYSTDTQLTERNSGTVWETYSDSASGGIPGPHASTHADGGSDEITIEQTQVVNLTTDLAAKAALTDPRFTDARFPLPHAISHASAGTDPVNVTALAGYPGGTANFLRADGTFAPPPSAPGVTRFGSITIVIDGGASPITTGIKGYLPIPFACTIIDWTLLSTDGPATVGSIVMDIWKDVFANYPPTVADTITAAAKPTLASVNKNQSSTLTGWNINIAAGDILGFNVDSIATLTKATLTLKVQAV